LEQQVEAFCGAGREELHVEVEAFMPRRGWLEKDLRRKGYLFKSRPRFENNLGVCMQGSQCCFYSRSRQTVPRVFQIIKQPSNVRESLKSLLQSPKVCSKPQMSYQQGQWLQSRRSINALQVFWALTSRTARIE
jgi:hypothetical protein